MDSIGDMWTVGLDILEIFCNLNDSMILYEVAHGKQVRGCS